MWRLTLIEDEQSVRELKNIASRLHLTVAGVPNFVRLLAKSPAAMNAYFRAEEALGQGRLTAIQREEIALAVAEINGSKYCLARHELTGKQAGLNDQDISLARKMSADDPKTKAMLHFVQAVVLQRGELSDADFSAVKKAGFSEAEIIEILANAVLNIFTNYFNILAQTDLDSPALKPEKNSRLAAKNVQEDDL